jgi:hypothetical protein
VVREDHSAELPARGGEQVGERGGAVLAVPGRGAAVALAGAGGVAVERVPAQREGPAEQAERDGPLAGALEALARLADPELALGLLKPTAIATGQN